MPITTATIFSICKIGPLNIQSFQTILLVKGCGFCHLDTKVTGCLEILVFCGYGGMGLNQNSPRKLSTYKDGYLVCFSDI